MVGCEDFCICDPSQTQNTGHDSHSVTLPSPMSTTRATCVVRCVGPPDTGGAVPDPEVLGLACVPFDRRDPSSSFQTVPAPCSAAYTNRLVS